MSAVLEFPQRHPVSVTEHGIREVWVWDLTDRTVRVFRDPGPSGYRTEISASAGDRLRPQAFPDVAIPLAELFPG